MNEPLSILHLESRPSDAALIGYVLEQSTIRFKRLVVADKEQFVHALTGFVPDVILSDHAVPSWNAKAAFAEVRNAGMSVPFLVVTRSVSEAYAADMLRAGISDYILKDQLARLPDAIRDAMETAKREAQQRCRHETLQTSEKKYRMLFDHNPMPMWLFDTDTLAVIDANEAAMALYGYTKTELLALHAADLMPFHAGDIDCNEDVQGIWQQKKKNGDLVPADITARPVVAAGRAACLVMATEVTEKVYAEPARSRRHLLKPKRVAEAVIQAQEQEREEIGKELHDNINQVLSATRLYLEFAKVAEPHLIPELIENSYRNIRQVIEEVRQLSHKLVPPSLGDTSLVHAITQLITNIRMVSSIKLTLVSADFDETAADTQMRLILYRIVQEQVNNILKHASARNATIMLQALPRYIKMRIEDDGTGFDTGKTASGIGLRNIINRAAIYNGTARITSAPGKGCVLEVEIPCPTRERNKAVAQSISE